MVTRAGTRAAKRRTEGGRTQAGPHLRLNSSVAIEVTEPVTGEEAELINVLSGFDDEPEAPQEPGKP